MPAKKIGLAEFELRIKIAIMREGGDGGVDLALIQLVKRVLAGNLQELDFFAPFLGDQAHQVNVEAAQFPCSVYSL